ncbi:hypothetical protein FHX82_005855 [Amycolatopsis bartoniae]|nr:hypothetical protein [Amycolatopsis bartoniae]
MADPPREGAIQVPAANHPSGQPPRRPAPAARPATDTRRVLSSRLPSATKRLPLPQLLSPHASLHRTTRPGPHWRSIDSSRPEIRHLITLLAEPRAHARHPAYDRLISCQRDFRPRPNQSHPRRSRQGHAAATSAPPAYPSQPPGPAPPPRPRPPGPAPPTTRPPLRRARRYRAPAPPTPRPGHQDPLLPRAFPATSTSCPPPSPGQPKPPQTSGHEPPSPGASQAPTPRPGPSLQSPHRSPGPNRQLQPPPP